MIKPIQDPSYKKGQMERMVIWIHEEWEERWTQSYGSMSFC